MFHWGIIGAGGIAHRMAEAIHMTENAELTAVASRSLSKAEIFGKQHHAARVYGSYEELYRDREIDAVYIATVHNTHAACAMEAMEYGKHVLIEKPMTVNLSEALAIQETALRQGVFCMEAMWIRFLPNFLTLQEWIAAGKLGQIQSVTADFSAKIPVDDPKNRLSNPDTAGGALLDLGVYPLNIAAIGLGTQPTKILGTAHKSTLGVDMDDAILLQYTNASAVLRTSLLYDGLRDAVIDGTNASVRIPDFITGDRLILQKGWHHEESIHRPYYNGFQYELEHVQERILAGHTQSDRMPLSETIAITGIMDELRRQWGLRYPFEREE